MGMSRTEIEPTLLYQPVTAQRSPRMSARYTRMAVSSVSMEKYFHAGASSMPAFFGKFVRVAPGQTVWLSRDVSDADRYGRLLRYVWIERPDDPADEGEIAGKMLNAILVRDGYAQVKRYKPDTTLHDLFQRWGDEAAADGRGVTHKWA